MRVDPLSLVIQLILSGSLIGGVYVACSLGLSLIIGVIRVINFAQGELMMLSMFATYFLFDLFGVHPILSFFVMIPAFFVVGFVIQKFMLERFLDKGRTTLLLLTFGLGLVLQNMALALWGATPKSIIVGFTGTSISIGPFFLNQARLIALIASLLMVVTISILLFRTEFGNQIRSVAQDRILASLMGVNVSKTYAIAFGIGVALVGGAGSLVTMYYPIDPTAGVAFKTVMLVVVVLGGLGSIKGALVGGLIVGITQQLSTTVFSIQLQNVIAYLVFVLFLIFRPSGLFGRR